MPNNFYDVDVFFDNYKQLRADKYNANDNIEKPCFIKLLPKLKNKRVLDLGCGMGGYILEFMTDAEHIDAVDVSAKMIGIFREEVCKRSLKNINIFNCSIEDYIYPRNHYDVVISTLVFHYIDDLDQLFKAISTSLKKDGLFVFSVEHPVLTANKNIGWDNNIGWEIDSNNNYMHWKLDDYFETGKRSYEWLGIPVVKYHRTLEDFVRLLNDNKFQITDILEPRPNQQDRALGKEIDGHYRRPIFLIFSAKKI